MWGILCRMSSIPHNVVMDMKNVMTWHDFQNNLKKRWTRTRTHLETTIWNTWGIASSWETSNDQIVVHRFHMFLSICKTRHPFIHTNHIGVAIEVKKKEKKRKSTPVTWYWHECEPFVQVLKHCGPYCSMRIYASLATIEIYKVTASRV